MPNENQEKNIKKPSARVEFCLFTTEPIIIFRTLFYLITASSSIDEFPGQMCVCVCGPQKSQCRQLELIY